MKRLLALTALLLAVTVTIGALVVLDEPAPPTFDEADAEAAFQTAIERCPGPGPEGKVNCDRAADGFACRAEGGYHGTFEMPDPEDPQITLVC